LLANVALVIAIGALLLTASAPPLPRRQSSGSLIELSVASLPKKVTLLIVAPALVQKPPP